ncbi:MAG TPA: hypothetical protein PK536_03145 [Ignavibacteria bacterium]|nr:hypothetical protein [Bacteroidota bacterium]HRI84423.1 hypothetical protein [Ignavibacteria bacterium]HRJ98669.1 hypothetical protein [Ignavibacteria bacterium]
MLKSCHAARTVLLLLITVSISSCELKSPSLPNYDIDLRIPFSVKSYNVFDIINRSGNIGIDSLNNNIIFIYGESNYRRVFGEDIKFDGIKKTFITSPSTLQLDTFITFNDSTFISTMDFLTGSLTFKFFNSLGSDYSVNAVIKNFFNKQNNDTVRLSFTVNAGSEKNITLELRDFYIKNKTPENILKIRISFNSPVPVPVNFSYTLSEYSIDNLEGRLKPLNTGISKDEVLDPFGSDVPEGELFFSEITPNKNFFVVKKFREIYQVDFRNISIIGENKNGHRVRLKYLKTGKPGDQIDSIFSLTLPQKDDSLAYPINEDNSNVREFINNIPKKIFVERTDFLNLNYQEGSVNYQDSLSLKLILQVPLDVSITEPIIFRDTADVGISDEDQRKELDKAKKLVFTLTSQNGIPLKTVAKVLVLDSLYNPLLPVSFILGNLPDSSVTFNACDVGTNGFSSTSTVTSYSAVLDSADISKIKRMGKIIYENKLFTDPKHIPDPLNSVKIRSGDRINIAGFGTLTYRIDPD